MNRNGRNKVCNFLATHKIKVIVYSSIFAVAFFVAIGLLQSTYNYVVSDYERDPNNAQICEDGIKTLGKMRYYRKSKNYIKQMTRSGVEAYCESHEFDEAKRFLDTYYQENLASLYDEIDDREAEYKEEERLRYMETREGRTKRVHKMYETMGFGGEWHMSNVPRELISKIEYGTLDDVGYLLPVWNRNDTYLNMLKRDMITISGYNEINPSSTFHMDDWYIRDDIEISAEDFEDYLERTYNISVDVNQVIVIEYDMVKRLAYSTVGTKQTMVVFSMDGKYFFGGVFLFTSDSSLQSLLPVDPNYKGQLTEEYE